jgi:hypothetical protein
VVECKRKTDSKGSWLSEVEDRGGRSGPYCYREVQSRGLRHDEDYADDAKRFPDWFGLKFQPGNLL